MSLRATLTPVQVHLPMQAPLNLLALLLPGSNSSGSPGSTTWTATTTRVPIQPFTSPTGPIEDISEHPIKVFNLFFTPDLMEEIVRQSNEYAKVVMGPDKYDRWTKITVEEFKALLGFSILMGINHLPSLDDYWSKILASGMFQWQIESLEIGFVKSPDTFIS